MNRKQEPSLDTETGESQRRPGHELRVAREQAGLEPETIAGRLRIARSQLEALERDDYAQLPPPTYVRGYLRIYAREVGLDPDDMVAAYDASDAPGVEPQIRPDPASEKAGSGRGALMGLLLIVLAAGGGAAAWWYQQTGIGEDRGGTVADSSAGGAGGETDGEVANAAGDSEAAGTDAGSTSAEDAGDREDPAAQDSAGQDQAGEEQAPEDAEADTTTASADGADTQAETGDTETSGSAGGDVSDAADSGDSTQAADTDDAAAPDDSGTEDTDADTNTASDAGSASAGVSGEEQEAGAEAAAGNAEADDDAQLPSSADEPAEALPAAASEGPDRLVLEFEDRSWVDVSDSRDRQLVRTLYYGSDPLEMRGWAPFNVFLGKAPVVEVRVNGQAVETDRFTRGNETARFQVEATGASTR